MEAENPPAEPGEQDSDAGGSRGAAFVRQFGRELIRPVRLLVWAILIAAVVVGVTLLWEASKGAIAGAALLGFFLVFTALAAHYHGEREFFRSYAKRRGMKYVDGIVRPPFSTDLFEKGRRQWTEQTVIGELEDGRKAMLGLFVYEVLRYVDPRRGTESTTEHRHTIVATDVPELREKNDNLLVQPRTGFRFFDSAEDAIKSGRHRVEVESEVLDRRYEVFVGDESDANAARQIFSPSFIDWLAHQPHNIGFQFERGELVVAVKGHHKSAKPLDELWERTGEIAKRLADEGREGERSSAAKTRDFAHVSGSATKSDRLNKRRGWVIAAMMLAAGAGLWTYLDYESAKQSPAEIAAEEREVEENLQFYKEHKCEISPNVYGCAGNEE